LLDAVPAIVSRQVMVADAHHCIPVPSRIYERSTHTGRPLGSSEFIQVLGEEMRRNLAPKKGGRPEKSPGDTNQEKFTLTNKQQDW
jgi:hypothetical protein